MLENKTVNRFMTIEDAFDLALKIKCKDIGKANYYDYQNRLKIFKLFLGANIKRPITSLKHSQILSFLQQYHGSNRNNYLKIIKSLLYVLIYNEHLDKNSAEHLRKVAFTQRMHEIYSKSQLKMIMDYVTIHYPWLRIFISLEYYQFLRPQEIRLLKNSNIRLDQKKICIPDKYGHTKVLPLHPEVEKLFPGLSSSDDYFFPSQQRDYFPGQFKRVKKKLKIPAGFTLYGFKHTGVVGLYRATKDIVLASKLCGHRSIKTTESYLRSLGEDTDFLDNSGVPVIG